MYKKMLIFISLFIGTPILAMMLSFNNDEGEGFITMINHITATFYRTNDATTTFLFYDSEEDGDYYNTKNDPRKPLRIFALEGNHISNFSLFQEKNLPKTKNSPHTDNVAPESLFKLIQEIKKHPDKWRFHPSSWAIENAAESTQWTREVTQEELEEVVNS